MNELLRRDPDAINVPPFGTEGFRRNLTSLLNTPFVDPSGARPVVGNYRWGVYAFVGYDGGPIHVGQTNERLRTRIRRHLTNQRTNAVAMSVLDPFEVFEIEVWPLPQFQESNRADLAARQHLDALEGLITDRSVAGSQFKAILNEKDPPPGNLTVEPPPSFRGRNHRAISRWSARAQVAHPGRQGLHLAQPLVHRLHQGCVSRWFAGPKLGKALS